MRILSFFIVMLAASVIVGCSKHSSPPTTDMMLTNRAAMGAFMTNSLPVLQARYHEVTNDSQKIKIRLDQLISAGKTNDQTYLDEQQRYMGLFAFSVDLRRQIALQQEIERHTKAQNSVH